MVMCRVKRKRKRNLITNQNGQRNKEQIHPSILIQEEIAFYFRLLWLFFRGSELKLRLFNFPLIFSESYSGDESLYLMQKQPPNLLIILTVLLTLQCTRCYLNQLSDSDIRSAIKSAVSDGLVTVDSFLRKEYWQYLQGSELSLYNVGILTHSLNYKIIYSFRNNIYRANCHIDKVTWQPYLNSLVKLPTGLASQLNSENSHELFLLDNGIKQMEVHPAQSDPVIQESKAAPSSNTLQNLTPIAKEPQQSPQSSGTLTISATSLSSQSSN